MQLYEVLRRPLITEKNTGLQASNKYVFEVATGANKPLVKAAVEKVFKVTVSDVNIVSVYGKKKRYGARMVAKPSWKKAIVTLKEGDKIQIFEGV